MGSPHIKESNLVFSRNRSIEPDKDTFLTFKNRSSQTIAIDIFAFVMILFASACKISDWSDCIVQSLYNDVSPGWTRVSLPVHSA